MKKFYCSQCQLEFTTQDNKAIKVKRNDPILGPVWHYEATCPTCKTQAKEVKSNLSTNGGNSTASNPACPTGTCPFMR